MEYLMTYGWAILVIIVVIAVLFYIGVLNPRNITPTSCTFPPGFSCATYKLNQSNGHMLLKLGHAVGRRIVITNISCTQYSAGTPSAGNYSLSANQSVNNGESTSNLDITCYPATGGSAVSGSAGDIVKFKMWINYTETDTIPNMNRTAVGDVNARFE